MKEKARSLWVALCGVLAALCLIAGIFVSTPAVEVTAETTTTVTMLTGASARKTEEPGIKFTAKIENYDSSYQYGMLILPEGAWAKFGWNNSTDYVAELNSKGVAYANKICSWYWAENGDRCISFSLINIQSQNYGLSFVGVAYTLKDGVYDYADVNLIDNARSIAYVAQMALKYEDALSVEQENVLKSYVNAGSVIEKDDYMTDGTLSSGGSVSSTEDNYAMKYTFNVSGESVALITTNAYAAGSAVSFKYYIPSGTPTSWWGVAWTTDATSTDIYAAASPSTANTVTGANTITGGWIAVSFTLPTSGGPYYLYFGSEVSTTNWKLNGENSYMLIDDFTVGSTKESFGAYASDSIFTVNSQAAVDCVLIEKGSTSFGGSEKEQSAKIYIDNINSDVGLATFVTKDSYEAGSTVTFKYYLPTDVKVGNWLKLCCVSDPSSSDIYANWILDLPIATGQWIEKTVALTSAGYLYIAGDVGQWGNGAGYVLIDDFSVTTNEKTVTDTFNGGVDKTLFNVNIGSAVVVGEGYVEVVDTTDYMLTFSAAAIGRNEKIAMITNAAYSGVTEVTFKAIWTGDAKSSRWGLSYTTDPTKFKYDGDTIGIDYINCYTPRLGELKMDAGVIYNYKVTFAGGTWTLYANDTQLSSGSYTDGENYFYIMVCPTVEGEGDIFYMDDFAIKTANATIIDTFEGGESTVFVNSATKNSDYGSTGMEFEESAFVESEGDETPDESETLGEVAMKFLFNNGDDGVRARTINAYAGGSTVAFKYYIQADTATQWTRFIWDTDTSCDNYANTYTSFGNTAGAWVTWSYTLPAGGPYYLYFGFECGNWKDSSGAPYILIDDFTVNGEVETFNYGVENSKFTILQPNLAGNSAVGEGYAPVNGAYGAKIVIDMISSTTSTPSFITANKYVSDGTLTVTFDYYMSGNVNDKWWTLNWTNNNTVANIYAFVEGTQDNDGESLPNVQNAWAKASVTIPAGEWYFYIAGAVGEWNNSNGYVIIDNFKIGEQVTETFNNGEYGIFLDNRDSKPDAITIADGKPDPIPGEYAVKLDFSNSFGTVATTFITKDSYAGGSTVSFRYMIPEETTIGDWWAICYDRNASNPDFWAVGNGLKENGGGVNPNPNKVKGAGWVEYSVTLPNDGNMYYLYIVGYQNWSGYVYIDNFTVTAPSGEVVEELFNTGTLEDSIFNVGNYGYVSLSEDGEGYVATEEEEKPTPETPVNPDPYAFENLLANGTIVSVLEDGSYASISSDVVINAENLPLSMIFLEGSFAYSIADEKEFAIWFGGDYYLFVNGSTIALYNDTTLVQEIAGTTECTLYVAITAGGKLSVKLDNGSYVGMGIVATPTQIKLVALGGDGSVQFASIAIESYSCLVTGIPSYMSSERIDFTAYAFDSNAMISDEGFRLLKEAGFTKTLALLQGRVNGLNYTSPSQTEVERLMAEVNADALAALELAEKYGLKHYVFNEPLYNLERHKAWYDWVDELKDSASYTLSNAFAGHYFADEPERTYNIFGQISSDELAELVNAYKAYKVAFPDSETYINLLPNTSSSLSTEARYNAYVDYYIENIAKDKDGVKGTGYVSFDIYPLKTTGIEAKHLRNFELVAEKCRDNNLELRFYIKASQSGDSARSLRATQSVNDLYLQIYSGLAYGGKEINYFQFTDNTVTDSSANAGDAVLNGQSLEKTNLYNWAAQANNEIHAFDAAYMNFTWQSASVFGSTSITQFNNLESKASAYGYISSVSSSASVLVGNFSRNEGVTAQYGDDYAYMVVNYGNTKTISQQSISITFNGTPTRALVYENGKPTVVRLSNNVLTLNLETGEGAFVIPLTD